MTTRVRARLEKVAAFLRPPPLDGVRLHPHPWNVAGHPYFVMNPVRNDDGHGGYARNHEFDALGVPFTRRRGEPFYDPLVAARYAVKMLAIHAATGDVEARRRADAVHEPLLASARKTAIWSTGPCAHRMSGAAPVGLFQAWGISALLRLSGGRPDPETTSLLLRAFEILARPLESGGCVALLGGAPFVQEQPTLPPTHNLGACIEGLFAAYDLADALGSNDAARFAGTIERALAERIGLFHGPLGWSRYALCVEGRALLASMHYHHSSLCRVRVVALRTGAPQLVRGAERWEHALRSPARRLGAGLLKIGQAWWLRCVLRLDLGESGGSRATRRRSG